jgi:putative membrane protein insertion efficiency factor
LYRKYISPLKGTKCPYYPSCSEYGLEAVKRYGAFKGSALTLYRIIRCNPLSKGGTDPVPESNAEIKMRYFPHIRNEEHI